MSLLRHLLILFAAVMISACATFTAPKNYDPSSTPGDGMVLVSFDQSYKVIKWMYRDLSSGKGLKGVNENFISTTDKFNTLIYDGNRIIYPFKLKPGKYEFFRWTLPEFGQYYASTNDFSIEFEVLPGAVTYIGNITMHIEGEDYHLMIGDGSEKDINNFLKQYTHVKPENIKRRIAEFKGFSQ